MINTIAIAVAVIFGVGVLAVLGLHLYVYGWIWLDSARLRRSLGRQGRTLALSEARDRIRQEQGMIIVDAPTLGWNVSRVWWSPVMDFATRPNSWQGDRLCPPEDTLNYKRFIAPSSGVAKLVDGFVFTQRVERFVARHFGSKPGFVFSAGVIAEERINVGRTEPGAAPNGSPATQLGNSGATEGPPSVS